MNIAILYSGGKDSTYAIQHAKEKGWNIKYLISVKPARKDCYLFHYATVELTKELSKILKLPHVYLECDVADPKKEAMIVRKAVEERQKNGKIDALVLGGTGLQETQLKSIQEALLPIGVEVFASHAGEDHDIVMEEMLKKGYEIIITQVASEGLSNWLGKKLTLSNFKNLKKDSIKYGFHIGFEGGYADTLVVDGPIFSKKLQINSYELLMEDNYCGHLNVKDFEVINKVKTSFEE